MIVNVENWKREARLFAERQERTEIEVKRGSVVVSQSIFC